jgi:hypothetical protein
MTALAWALAYAATGRRVFPLADKRTSLIRWKEGATTDPAIITEWWTRRPDALIGAVTGEVDCVLDVDPPDGFATLAALSVSPEHFETPAAFTPRGGLHLHYAIPASGPFPGTAGAQGCGIGANLDWRCKGNYIVLPSPGSGYEWEPAHTPAIPLAEAPPGLLPRKPEAPCLPKGGDSPQQGRHTAPSDDRRSLILAGAFNSAERAILAAPNGQQEAVFSYQCFSIGRLVAGIGGQGEAIWRLISAGERMTDYDPRRPWTAQEIARKVEQCFQRGLRRGPRPGGPR